MSDQDHKPPYVTVQAFAKRHGVAPVTARLWCVEGRIPGAHKVGRDWIIPESATKPLDGRVTRWQD